MKLSDIKNKLLSIKESKGLEGVSFDLIINALSQSIYMNESIINSKISESNLLTASSINSLIVHGVDRGYSIFRGQNIVYTIYGLMPSQTKTNIKKFDKFIDFDEFSLLYNKDYDQLKINEEITMGIEVILVLKSGVKTLVKEPNTYITLIPHANISESLVILNIDGIPYELYSSYESWIVNKKENYNQLIILTAPEYGIYIVNPNKSDKDLYNIKYLEYLDKTNLDITKIKGLIKDFKFTDNYKVEITDFNYRLEDKDTIRYEILNAYKSAFIVRSNDDLEFLVRRHWRNKIVGLNIVKNADGVYIYYKSHDNTEFPQLLVDDFIKKLKLSYYIYDKINMIKATNVDVDLHLLIYYKSQIPTKIVESTIQQYTNKIGGVFNPHQLLGLLNDSDYINYIDPLNSLLTKITLNSDQYINLKYTVEYINDSD